MIVHLSADRDVVLGPPTSDTEHNLLLTTLHRALVERELTVAFAESLTAGMAASDVASIPGASKILKGGIVTYTSEAKAKFLCVDIDLAQAHRGVHPGVASQMAEQVRREFQSDFGVSFTGFATPVEDFGQARYGKQHAFFAISGPVLGADIYRTSVSEVVSDREIDRNVFRREVVHSAFLALFGWLR